MHIFIQNQNKAKPSTRIDPDNDDLPAHHQVEKKSKQMKQSTQERQSMEMQEVQKMEI